jgi:hypothetical protein
MGGAADQAADKMQAHAAAQPVAPANPALTPAARRALAEAAERRRLAALQPPPPREFGGRDGPEPVRYGDYEKNGLAVDF